MKGKVYFKYLVITAIIILFCLAIYYLYYQAQRKKEVAAVISKLPYFVSQTPDGIAYSFPNAQSRTKKYTLICYISTDCDHCARLIDTLKTIKSKLNDAAIVIITMSNKSKFKQFAKDHFLTEWQGLTLLNDTDFQVFNLLNISRFPTVFLYNNNSEILIDKFQGEFNVNQLFK